MKPGKTEKRKNQTQQKNLKPTNQNTQNTKLKHFFGIFLSWQGRNSSKPKGASGFEVNIAPEHVKTPVQKSTMPRLLKENSYLWGTIARKDFLFLFFLQCLVSTVGSFPSSPSVYPSKLACILIASASHLMTIVLVCQKNYNKYPNLQD